MHDESKRLFVEALGVIRAEREEYLQDACAGDEPLLQEVRSLLRHHDEMALTEPGPDDERGGLRRTLRTIVRSWVVSQDEAPNPPSAPLPGDRPTQDPASPER